MSFLFKSLNEIKDSRLLQIYGAMLALGHIATWCWWNLNTRLQVRLLDEIDCWPFLSHCENWRVQVIPWVKYTQSFYLALSCGVVFLFLFRRTVGLGILGLGIATLIEVATYLQDYKLMGNYLYMFHWVLFVYFCLQNKRQVIMVLIFLFYFFAGILKLNTEWLTGGALFGVVALPAGLLSLACSLVVVLELFVSFGLFARSPGLFWSAFISFILFHSFSWHIVGFYYPVMMFLLLSIFFMNRVLNQDSSRNLNTSFSYSLAGAVFIFMLAQAWPWQFKGPSALTGEGRFTALNMFDGNTQCREFKLLKTTEAWIDFSENRVGLAARIKCDPLLVKDDANQFCDRLGSTQLLLGLSSRLSHQLQTTSLFSEKNYCEKAHHYNVLGFN